MKLLHVHDFFAPGNSRYGFDIDRLLAGRGHEVHVLAGTGERGPADGAAVEGVTFHTYPFPAELGTWARFLRARNTNARRFGELHARHRFDLVVLNQPMCAHGVLSHPAAASVPKVYSFISPWAAEWRASHPRAFYFWRRLHEGLRNRLEGRALAACEAVVVESEFIRKKLGVHHPSIPASRVTLIPGAVDLAKFCPDGPQEKNRERFGIGPGPVVLTVRRLVERMGVDLLIEAMSRLPGVKLFVGGEGPLRKDLEAQAEALGVRARFLGFVPDEDLPALYRAADLMVLPTRELEGFGLVAIEAMACGTPAMGTPVGAIPEVLGPLGLMFGAATAEAIGEGIKAFFFVRDAQLPKRCREHVAGKYDWNTIISKFEELFIRVSREGPGHRRP